MDAANANKEVVRRLVEEVLGGGRMQVLVDLVAPEHVGHFPLGDHYGPEGVRLDIAALRSAFPGLTVDLEDLLVDGEYVVRRFTLRGVHDGPFLGVPATGCRVELAGIGIDRLSKGQIVESWVQLDGLGFFRQLGMSAVVNDGDA